MIKFGVHAKGIGNIDLLHGTFFADLVVSLEWEDLRAAKIAQDVNVESLTLSYRAAQERIWLPDVRLSSRTADGVDLISSATMIHSNGTVAKIDRMLASLTNEYTVTSYPFDRQLLEIALTSETLMHDELVFQPLLDPSATGCDERLLKESEFTVKGYNISVMDEVDGHLHKSRGLFAVEVKRLSAPYFQSLLLPELLVLSISMSVFWFPSQGVFVMPRVTTALISFLTLTTLGLRTNSMLPMRGGLVWVDLFELCCQTLMLFILMLNIFILVIFHTFKEEALAERLDAELKIFFPTVAAVIFSLCFYNTDAKDLLILSFAVNYVIIIGVSTYVGACVFRLHTRLKETRKILEDAGAPVEDPSRPRS